MGRGVENIGQSRVDARTNKMVSRYLFRLSYKSIRYVSIGVRGFSIETERRNGKSDDTRWKETGRDVIMLT